MKSIIYRSFVFVAILLQQQIVNSTLRIAVDEGIETCVEPEKKANYLDWSRLELIAPNDIDVFLNGSLKFLKPVKDSFMMYFYSEKFDRGQWTSALLTKKIKDFCTVMHNPTEIWYAKTKHLKSCPIPAGVSKINNKFPFNY